MWVNTPHESTDTNKLSELTAKQRWDNMALYKMVSIYDSYRKSRWLLGSTSIRHRYEAFAFNWCLITVDLDVFAIWDLSSATRLFTAGNSVIYTILCSIHWIPPRHTQLVLPRTIHTVYHKKYAHGFCFAVLCCGYTLTDYPISIRLTSLALWQSNDCPSASKATLMNMDKYFMWIHYERLHNHNKAKHNKTVCIFIGIYCIYVYTIVCMIILCMHVSGSEA